mmetsp:Transcript_5213/g.4796  ORF Transcript_5213/g.4796 Transcript_5213/m.4796 type:complete len:138 (+) Transcript_5213:641-1054(+)
MKDYPYVRERLMKKTTRYYLNKFTFKSNHPDYMPLEKVEELFMVSKPMLGYVVEDLVHKGRTNEAKGITLRHELDERYINSQAWPVVKNFQYKPEEDIKISEDKFAPQSEPIESFIQLPAHLKVTFIDSEDQLHLLN